MEKQKCTKCGIEKDLSMFHKDRSRKLGVRSGCKECLNKYADEYNKSHKKEKNEWYKKNKEKVLSYSKEYYENNKEAVKERHDKRYRAMGIPKRGTKEFKEMKAYYSGERSSGWKGGITEKNRHIRNSNEYAEWRKSCFERDGYRCVITGMTGDLAVHHIEAFNDIAKGLSKENFKDNKELFCIDNGITMLNSVHIEFHKRYGTIGFSFNDLIEFKKYMADLSV